MDCCVSVVTVTKTVKLPEVTAKTFLLLSKLEDTRHIKTTVTQSTPRSITTFTAYVPKPCSDSPPMVTMTPQCSSQQRTSTITVATTAPTSCPVHMSTVRVTTSPTHSGTSVQMQFSDCMNTVAALGSLAAILAVFLTVSTIGWVCILLKRFTFPTKRYVSYE